MTARYARRAVLRAAVFGAPDPGLLPPPARTAVSGVLAGVSQHAIVVSDGTGEHLLRLSPATVTWLGARAAPSALRAGDPVIVRREQAADHGCGSGGTAVAERIWARIGRVAGAIVAADGRECLVDTGRPGHLPERVVIAGPAMRQVQVRFPRLAPGYLIDVIGTRHGDHLLAVAPATAQPPRVAGLAPAPPSAGGHLAGPVSGTAVWHEAADGEPRGLRGLAYPALDPETEGRPAVSRECVRLPYLSLGSAVRISNECTGSTAVLPVTSCGASSRMFCDRCVHCGTSPRGRVADLTTTAFVELGGNLEDGCFNATVAVAD